MFHYVVVILPWPLGTIFIGLATLCEICGFKYLRLCSCCKMSTSSAPEFGNFEAVEAKRARVEPRTYANVRRGDAGKKTKGRSNEGNSTKRGKVQLLPLVYIAIIV